jgi:voltage-gated potassium channel Kch
MTRVGEPVAPEVGQTSDAASSWWLGWGPGAGKRLAVPGLGRGIALAGAAAQAVAAGLSVFLWLNCELASTFGAVPVGRQFGPFQTLGPVCYGLWLVAALGRCVAPAWAGRLLTVLALAGTAVLPVVSPASGYPRPPGYVLLGLLSFGALALLGYPRRPAAAERILIGLGAAAVFALSAVPTLPFTVGSVASYSPRWSQLGPTTALTALAVLVTGLVRGARGERLDWLWAGLLLAVPGSASFVAAEPDITFLPVGRHQPVLQALVVMVLVSAVVAATVAVAAGRLPGPARKLPLGRRHRVRRGREQLG